ncbi:heat shock factor family protein [Skeletonema marinoi]|uniref:Heat shock factor family protein n=1 Tax=Skeletonema marinoi TaxID=267567 RepID=A0AAD8YH02_9STRA|nr:heat shock factor family protein [Skeletonema marinoi]
MNNNKLLTTSSMANGGRHHQPLSESYSKEVEDNININTNTNTNTMDAAPGATVPSGLDLLFTASQVETKPNEGAEAEREAERADVPFTIAVVSNGTGTAEAECESVSNNDEEEPPSSDDGAEKSTTGAIKVKDQGLEPFPQILQEILNTSDYQSIAHWLPDGLSFIITDKRRFADEIIPKHFRRVAIFHSFIRKLNRYGFRRIKGTRKGDESSFAHKDFVRDEPWLCLNMTCKSKPSYHKAPSAKKKKQHAAAATATTATTTAAAADDEAANRLANDALIAPAAQLPPSFLAAGGMMMDARRVFVPTTYMPVTRTLPLPLPLPFPMARAAIGPLTTAAAVAAVPAIQERQFLASILPEHPQQYIFDERQILMLQMRQRHRLQQVQLQRLHEMSALNEEQYLSYHHMVTQRRPRADSSAAMKRAKGQEPSTKRRRREDE